MKIMKSMGAVLTVLLFTFVVMGSAEARRGEGQGRPGGYGDGGPGLGCPHPRMLDRLDLTKEQKQKVAAILKEHREAIGKNQQAMMEARTALRTAMTADDLSEAAVREAAVAKGKQMEESAVLSAGILREVRQVLTPEQKKMMLQMREGRRGKGRHSPEDRLESRLSGLDKWIEENSK